MIKGLVVQVGQLNDWGFNFSKNLKIDQFDSQNSHFCNIWGLFLKFCTNVTIPFDFTDLLDYFHRIEKVSLNGNLHILCEFLKAKKNRKMKVH